MTWCESDGSRYGMVVGTANVDVSLVWGETDLHLGDELDRKLPSVGCSEGGGLATNESCGIVQPDDATGGHLYSYSRHDAFS